MTITQSLAGFLTTVALASALALTTEPALAQVVEIVSPVECSASGAPRFRLSGFAPGEEVRVSFFRTPPDGARPAFGSSATYIADNQGQVAPGAILGNDTRAGWTFSAGGSGLDSSRRFNSQVRSHLFSAATAERHFGTGGRVPGRFSGAASRCGSAVAPHHRARRLRGE